MKDKYEQLEQAEQDALWAEELKMKRFEEFVLTKQYDDRSGMISYLHELMLEHGEGWHFFIPEEIDEGGTMGICIYMGFEEATKQFKAWDRRRKINESLES